MTLDPEAPALLADLGATNARFALVGPNGIGDVLVLPAADHPSLAAAARAYLDRVNPPQRPRRGAMAVASPITGDAVVMTNLGWSFSIAGLRAELGLDRLEVVNDFTAVALAVPLLGDADRRQIGGGAPVAGMPIGVLGPGTGLGVSGLVHGGGRWIPLAGEGGHVTMPATDEREAAVLEWLRQRHSHVSAERVISGMGLVNLYEALAAVDGQTDAAQRAPHHITEAARGGIDPLCTETVAMFCAMLGTVAGNLALSLGARGGVYIAGGIVPRFAEAFAASAFRERFEAKGRLRSYLEPIPTYLVTHAVPAFLGLCAVLDAAE